MMNLTKNLVFGIVMLGLALLAACTEPSSADEEDNNGSADAGQDGTLDGDAFDPGESCDPVENWLQSQTLEDCGSIRTPMMADECWDAQLSCFQSAFDACRPAVLHHLQEGFPDGGDVAFTYVIDGTRSGDGGCLVKGFIDQRSLDALPENRALYRFQCDDFISTENMCILVTVASACPGIEALGSCADLYLDCSVCN